MNQTHQDILRNIPSFGRFLTVHDIDSLVTQIYEFPTVNHRTIGKTINDEPLELIEIGKGAHTALIIGVPHSDEPLGSLVISYFARWLATHPSEDLGWRWLFIPILERRGMRLNEGWFQLPDSLAIMAKTNFREPTEDQYEWTFPIEYQDYQWTQSRPEAIAVKNLLEHEKPDLLCNLHHCGFHNAYYYLSRDFPEIYPALRRLAASVRIPLSDTAPDVPFGKMYAPGFYQMYGLKDYLEYYRTKDPLVLPTLKRGACSDEWFHQKFKGFSFNCEVPMYLTPKLQDKKTTDIPLRTILEHQYQRKEERISYSQELMKKLKEFALLADRFLLNVADKHIKNAQTSLEHEQRILATTEQRNATRTEAFENEVLADLFDLFFLGQIWRVAESICIKGEKPRVCQLMESADIEIKSLAKSIQERGVFYQLPIRNLVKLQLGSILIIADALLTQS